jgi:RimJ/RimL family protein N-acetyltransferase
MFEFRQMKPTDFPQMLEWLQKEHVKLWWNDGDDTLEKVMLHYGEHSEDVKRFILIETNRECEKPIGYFQYYFAPHNQIGIDQFIGEENYLNRGIGEKTIKMFVEIIIRRNAPNAIILDPSPDNKRAIRCYEKVGFNHFETRQTEEGNTVYLMRYEI